MSQLVQNTLPAERDRGCVWAERFDNAGAVARNGGQLFGGASVADGKLFLDGTGYAKYGLTGRELGNLKTSITQDCWPDFEADDNSPHYLWDTASTYRCLLVKTTGNDLLLRFNNVTIATVPLATYQSFWKVGEKNTFVVSAVSGDTSLWLNGNLIVDSSAVTWTVGTTLNIYVGSDNAGNNQFSGAIGTVRIFHQLLTEQEAIDYYTGKTFRYMEQAAVHLPMSMRDHDPDNNQTLDRSGKANHGVLGDGAGNNEPVKLAGRGYGFAGAESANITGATSGTSHSHVFVLNSSAADALSKYLLDSQTGRLICAFFGAASGQIGFFDGAWTLFGQAPNDGLDHVVVFTFDGVNAIAKLYVDGFQVGTDKAYTPKSIGGTTKVGGAFNDGASNYYEGELYQSLTVKDRALTPLQVHDLTRRLRDAR
jgi:hypothetical protein